MPVFSIAHFRGLAGMVGIGLLLYLVTGCGGGQSYSVDEGAVAERYLPAERTVRHHPDSLRALTIREDESQIQYDLEDDYESLVWKWSSTSRDMGAGGSRRTRTYATLWSWELALVSLQPEKDILALPAAEARRLIEKRKDEYDDTIQINVYWFLEDGNSGVIGGILTEPDVRLRLHIADSTYRPTRTEHGSLQQGYLGGGTTALYRRNILHFPRNVDGTDLLAGAEGASLVIRTGGREERFRWRWGEPDRPSAGR